MRHVELSAALAGYILARGCATQSQSVAQSKFMLLSWKSADGHWNYFPSVNIAENLSKAGWSWGCVSAVDSNGRAIWIADAHRDDGKRFVVRADEKRTAFLELESG